ncbi:hypothetical protein, partial [Streptomyces chartreusis]|uniref:hypothetical protein n=1 Tax=Streptomyces chartreusis TaxID=1969 RepID=UPI0034213C72
MADTSSGYTGLHMMHPFSLPAEATALARVPQFALARITLFFKFRLRNFIPALALELRIALAQFVSLCPGLPGHSPRSGL